MKWNLKRTTQCAHCPWRKDITTERDVPRYNEVKHRTTVAKTIAKPGDFSSLASNTINVMACHETDNAHCLGWLMNQLGPGNNIALRIDMLNCGNIKNVRLIGEQHERFEDTLPS